MAAYSSLTSPICTWPVANYLSSVAYQKNHNTWNSSMFQYPKRHKKLMSRSRCSNINGFSSNTIAVSLQPEEELKTEKQQRKVAVTGMGVVTPLDHHPDVFYSNLLEGVSGISEIESFDCSKFPTRIAGEIKSLSTDGWVSPKHAKRADKFMLYILTAGKKALADGGVTEQVNEEFDKIKCGVLIGSALGGMKTIHQGIEALKISLKKVHPFTIPYVTTNIGSAVLAMDLGWMGPNYSISSACATGNSCILNAAHHIIKGDADIMLCGGSDAAIIPAGIIVILQVLEQLAFSNLIPVHELIIFSFLIIGAAGLAGFVACRALSGRNKDPIKASRPWDTDRDGLIVGEGAGVLLLEEMEHAKRRSANIYAEFLGGSFSSDAHNIARPHPDGMGIVSCIEKALTQSGVAREDVNYINAHASSTPVGDLIEYQALMHCFGQNPELKVNSTKSMIGHLLGASGAVEAVATVMAIKTGWLHPNLNLENPDERVDGEVLVGSKKERLDIKVALSNSFGLGGHNSSILFAPYKQL